jgi:hypothetical protein
MREAVHLALRERLQLQVVAAFNVGTPTVRIQGELGNAQLFLGTDAVNCQREDFTYTVTALPALRN